MVVLFILLIIVLSSWC
ncbi:YjcZ family sporulation protein [Neobacillus vireti]